MQLQECPLLSAVYGASALCGALRVARGAGTEPCRCGVRLPAPAGHDRPHFGFAEAESAHGANYLGLSFDHSRLQQGGVGPRSCRSSGHGPPGGPGEMVKKYTAPSLPI